MPLTLLKTPLKPFHASNSNIKTRVSLSEAALVKNTISYILTLNNVFLITIKYKELPYS
jgi:hypothetical protein